MATKSEELFNEIRNSIPTYYEKFGLLDCDVECTSELDGTGKKPQAEVLRTEKLSLLLKCFEQAFSTMGASPDRASFFTSSYAFPNARILSDHGLTNGGQINAEYLRHGEYNEIIANVSPDYVSTLVGYFIERAKESTDPIINVNSHHSRKLFFIIGPAGVGKTTFLNYIFSVHAERLRKEKVIWVRLDLGKHDDRTETFQAAFAKKAIRILREKYWDILSAEMDNFKQYLEDEWQVLGSLRDQVLSDISNQIKRFITMDPTGEDAAISEAFGKKLIEFLQQKRGYCMIMPLTAWTC
jgi:hypothetical protein